jgi:hypothetical protein
MKSMSSAGIPVARRPDAHCFAIVGSNAFTGMLAARLRDLRTGRVDLFRPGGDFGGRSLTLTDVARYDAIFVTDEDVATVDHLNESCLLARVHLVVVGTHGDHFSVSSYPFASGDAAACHACNAATATPVVAPTVADTWDGATASQIAAGFALSIGPQAAWRGGGVSRRLTGSARDGRTDTLDVMREPGCPVCGGVLGTVRILRTRNRWTTPAQRTSTGPDALAQRVQLSEAIVSGATCDACGELSRASAAHVLNRRAREFGSAPLSCPSCRTGSLHLASRREFSVGELVECFGDQAVPVRYALATIGAATVCFDFSDDARRARGYWSMESGTAAAGAGAAGVGAVGATLTPDDGCTGAGVSMTSIRSTK